LLSLQLTVFVNGWTSPKHIRLVKHPFRPSFVGISITELAMGLRGKKIRREKRKAMQEPTPPRVITPYGPIRLSKPPKVCYQCRGRGVCRCSVCEGRGVVRATGHRKRNSFNVDKLVHSQWSSVEVYNGHRHHTVVETRGSKRKGNLEIRMRNCCGPQEDFWIPEEELRDKRVWRMGWLTLDDILKAGERNGGVLIDARICFRCKGERILLCVDCDGKGQIPNYEPLHEI
jgi:tryptophan-rich hypothetical protein